MFSLRTLRTSLRSLRLKALDFGKVKKDSNRKGREQVQGPQSGGTWFSDRKAFFAAGISGLNSSTRNTVVLA